MMPHVVPGIKKDELNLDVYCPPVKTALKILKILILKIVFLVIILLLIKSDCQNPLQLQLIDFLDA